MIKSIYVMIEKHGWQDTSLSTYRKVTGTKLYLMAALVYVLYLAALTGYMLCIQQIEMDDHGGSSFLEVTFFCLHLCMYLYNPICVRSCVCVCVCVCVCSACVCVLIGMYVTLWKISNLQKQKNFLRYPKALQWESIPNTDRPDCTWELWKDMFLYVANCHALHLGKTHKKEKSLLRQIKTLGILSSKEVVRRHIITTY